MKILKGYRRCGKTTYAIKEAFRQNAIIITGNERMKRIIIDQSKEMHMPVEVMTYDEYLKKMPSKKIIIDQLEFILPKYILENALFATTDLEVSALLATFEWENKNYFKKKIKVKI